MLALVSSSNRVVSDRTVDRKKAKSRAKIERRETFRSVFIPNHETFSPRLQFSFQLLTIECHLEELLFE